MSADSKKTILIVDDASLVRMYCRSVLEGAGLLHEAASFVTRRKEWVARDVDGRVQLELRD